jgi:hypothetical protein
LLCCVSFLSDCGKLAGEWSPCTHVTESAASLSKTSLLITRIKEEARFKILRARAVENQGQSRTRGSRESEAVENQRQSRIRVTNLAGVGAGTQKSTQHTGVDACTQESTHAHKTSNAKGFLISSSEDEKQQVTRHGRLGFDHDCQE